MDELSLLRTHQPEFGPRSAEPPAAETARFHAELAAATTALVGPSARRRRPARSTWTRPTVRRFAPVAAAAAITGLVLTGVTLTQLRDERPRPNDARQVLLLAAAQAEARPFTPPAPGSFVYTRVRRQATALNEGGTTPHPETGTTEYWLSADGRASGLARTSNRVNGTPVVEPSPGPSDTIDPDGVWTGPIDPCPGPRIKTGEAIPDSYCMGPGYAADVPTEPAAAIAYLVAAKGWNGWSLFEAGLTPQQERLARPPKPVFPGAEWETLLQDLTREVIPKRQLSPAAWAAVFRGLADAPGATVSQDARALDGRTGIAVRFAFKPWPGVKQTGTVQVYELIFDSDTYTVIGWRDYLPPGWYGPGSTSSQDDRYLVEESAVVAAAGVRPDGTHVR